MSKQSYFKQFTVAKVYSLLFFDPLIITYRVLPFLARVDEGAMALKGYFSQSTSISGTSPSDCLVSYKGHSFVGVLPLSREAVGVFNGPSRLGKSTVWDYEISD